MCPWFEPNLTICNKHSQLSSDTGDKTRINDASLFLWKVVTTCHNSTSWLLARSLHSSFWAGLTFDGLVWPPARRQLHPKFPGHRLRTCPHQQMLTVESRAKAPDSPWLDSACQNGLKMLELIMSTWKSKDFQKPWTSNKSLYKNATSTRSKQRDMVFFHFRENLVFFPKMRPLSFTYLFHSMALPINSDNQPARLDTALFQSLGNQPLPKELCRNCMCQHEVLTC